MILAEPVKLKWRARVSFTGFSRMRTGLDAQRSARVRVARRGANIVGWEDGDREAGAWVSSVLLPQNLYMMIGFVQLRFLLLERAMYTRHRV